MSRIGKQLITVPDGVAIKLDGQILAVKGPKGELRQAIHPQVKVNIQDNVIGLNVDHPENKQDNALWGLFGSLIKNMITGVTVGFSKKLEINGIGFKAAVSGQKLVLNVGFSHPVDFKIPAGISVKTEANFIEVSGADKQLVGEVAAQIRRIKKPEPYKGSGIKYADEQLRRKAGKTAAK
jgi:large subunit ribosomal protein L6